MPPTSYPPAVKGTGLFQSSSAEVQVHWLFNPLLGSFRADSPFTLSAPTGFSLGRTQQHLRTPPPPPRLCCEVSPKLRPMLRCLPELGGAC